MATIDFASISTRFIKIGILAGIDPSVTSLVLGTGVSSASQEATPFSIYLPGTYDAHQMRNGKAFESRAVIVVSWTLFRKWMAGEIASGMRVANFVLGARIEGDEAMLEALMGKDQIGGLPRAQGTKPYLPGLGVRHASARNGLPAGNKTRITSQRYQPLPDSDFPEISDLQALMDDFHGCVGCDANGNEYSGSDVNKADTEAAKKKAAKKELKEAEEAELLEQGLVKVSVGALFVTKEEASRIAGRMKKIDSKVSATQKALTTTRIVRAAFALPTADQDSLVVVETRTGTDA